MNIPVNDGTVNVISPAAGRVLELDAVSDPAFSSGALGPGAAVQPTQNTICAPASGQLIVVMPHAYGIRTDEGVELLVHVGIDTVKLQGKPFRVLVSKGQTVNAGAPLCTVDLDALRDAGIDSTVMVVVTNAASLPAVIPIPRDRAECGDPLITMVIR